MQKGKENKEPGDFTRQKITSPLYLKKVLREKKLSPLRSMGQHFLIDENILLKIIDAAMLEKKDLVIDIGAGPGALSLTLAEKVGGVIAIEWDTGLANLLKAEARSRGLDNLHVVEGDVRRLNLNKICLQQWGEKFAAAETPGYVKVVANLPYYLTTPLLFKLLQGRLPLERLVLMVQLEVARRILAAPGSKDYGTLSLLCRFYTEPRLLFKVSRRVFYPPPDVDSAVVLLTTLSDTLYKVQDEKLFWQIVKASFQQRRKTVLNALDGIGGLGKADWQNLLHKSGISPLRRGETLTLKEFANLSDIFYNK